MRTQYLTPQERRKGRWAYLQGSLFNGLGFSFLGSTVISLLAISYGATNLELGYLSSVINVAGLALLFVPRLLEGLPMGKVWAVAWWIRGATGLGYWFLLLTSGRGAVLLILVLYTLFCVARIVGIAMQETVQKRVAPSHELGEFISSLNIRFQITGALSQVISFVAVTYLPFPHPYELLFLLSLGVVMNSLAAYYYWQVPSRDRIQRPPGASGLWEAARYAFSRDVRRRTSIRWVASIVFTLQGMIVPFLRKVLLFSQGTVFLYSLAAFVVSALAGMLMIPFVDRMGARPLLILGTSGAAVCVLLFVFMPLSAPVWAFFLVGMAFQFFVGVVGLFVSKISIQMIPDGNTAGFSSFMTASTALIALGSGFLAGVLSDLSGTVPGTDGFDLVFLAMGAGLFVLVFLAAGLKERGEMSVRDVLSILFSTRNLRVFLASHALVEEKDPQQKQVLLFRITQDPGPLADRALRDLLLSPFSPEKKQILLALFEHPRPSLLPYILKEAADPDSYVREEALFALGAYPGEETRRLLEEVCRNDHLRPASVAAKSLARIGEKSFLPLVEYRLREQREFMDPVSLLNYVIAWILMGPREFDLFFQIPSGRSQGFLQTYHSLLADLLDGDPPLSLVYQRENRRKGAGLSLLLDEARHLDVFLKARKDLRTLWEEGRFADLGAWTSQVLAGVPTSRLAPVLGRLADLVREAPVPEGRAEALALLYWCYTILSRVAFQEDEASSGVESPKPSEEASASR